MIRFLEDFSLKQHNTFGFDVKAKFYFAFTELADLHTFLHSNQSWEEEKLLILGQGSNILFTGDFNGLVIQPQVPGIFIIKEDRQNVWIEAGAGENWDDLVQFTVDSGFGGIENLSLIPGNVGAAPVQNIGAYGQEAGNVIEKVKGFDLQTGEIVEFSAAECEFGYRSSIFKSTFKNRIVITSVVFKLGKFPELVLGYGDVEKKASEKGEINLSSIRQAIIEIRSSKLPDVTELGNAGSFFKNPVVLKEKADAVKQEYPDLPVYPVTAETSKLAAGWLIEKAGWKGFRDGDAGVHEKQALVLVNYGNATGKQIFDLSEKIKQSVFEKFGVDLEREVNCV